MPVGAALLTSLSLSCQRSEAETWGGLMKGLAIMLLFLSTTAFAQTLQQATLDGLHLTLAEEYDTPKKMAKCYRSKNCTPVMVETIVLRQKDKTLVLVKRIPTSKPSPDMNLNHSADQCELLSERCQHVCNH
jgi:hypothetical protein